MRIKTAAAAVLIALAAGQVWAVNKCTQPDGTVAFQDAPCASDAKKAEAVKTWGGNTTASKPASAYRVDPDFSIKVPPSGEPLMGFYRRWADAEKLALATARIALAQPVASLQALQREVEAFGAPACFEPAKSHLVSLLSRNVQVMISFMGKEDLSGMVYQFVDRAKMIRAFEGAMRSARCEP